MCLYLCEDREKNRIRLACAKVMLGDNSVIIP
jgi:hypothetical protein